MRGSAGSERAAEGTAVSLLEQSFALLPAAVQTSVRRYLRAGKPADLLSLLAAEDIAALAAIDAGTRAPFYLALERVDRTDDAMLVRLGRLLSALPSWRDDPPGGAPASVWALLDDAIRAVFWMRRGAPAFTTLSIERLRALLALEGVAVDRRDEVIISLLLGSSRGGPRGLQSLPGLAHFAAEHPDAVAAAAQHFTPSSFIELMRLAASHPPLAAAIAQIVCESTFWPTIDVRSAALVAFASVPIPEQVSGLNAALGALPLTDRPRVVPAADRISDPPLRSRCSNVSCFGERPGRQHPS